MPGAKVISKADFDAAIDSNLMDSLVVTCTETTAYDVDVGDYRCTLPCRVSLA